MNGNSGNDCETKTAGSALRPTWLEIDLSVLTSNVRELRRRIGPRRLLYAVVKANAYGHGADLIAASAMRAGADRLAVAAVNEAVALRRAGLDAPILVLGYTPPELAQTLLEYALTATVYEARTALAFAEAAARQGQPLPVHLKVDTGMHRLGVDHADALELCARLNRDDHLRLEGIYTHFSTADEVDQRYSREQLRRFCVLLDRLVSAAVVRPSPTRPTPPPPWHCRRRIWTQCAAASCSTAFRPAPISPRRPSCGPFSVGKRASRRCAA